jgi:glycosyltransferase involved in cell wall biosynthesis
LWLAEWLTQACSTHTWVLSQGLLQQGLQAGFLQQGKCSVQGYGSSNGVDYARFALATPDAALAELEAHGTQPGGRQVWLYVGRLVHEKGLDELLAAFEALQARHPQHLLVCIGPLEPQRDPLMPESLRLLQQHPAVVHIPWSGHIAAWLKLAHCLVHPSHREGLPNVLLEAGAAGCPILASRIAGNTDVVSSEALGYLFTPGDTQDLLQKMLAIQAAAPEEKAGKAALLQQLVAARYERRQVQEALHLAYKAQLEHAGLLPHSA